jgi:hypothetical protein
VTGDAPLRDQPLNPDVWEVLNGRIIFRKNVTRFITLVEILLVVVLKYCSVLAFLFLSFKPGGEMETVNR